MGQQGRVVLPGGLQGNGALQAPSVEQMLAHQIEQAEWPTVSEWVVMEQCRFGVSKLPDGTRVVSFWAQGMRRGVRIPIQAIPAARLAKELGSGEAVVPESDEVAAEGQPVEPPAPPTMGQSE